jgi:serine protease Do
VTLGQLPSKRQASLSPDRAPNDRAQSGGPNSERETTGRGSAPGGSGGATDVDLGLMLAPAIGQGVVVTGVDPTGLAADQGVELGDVILEVGGKSVKSPDEIQGSVRDARRDGKQTVLLRLKSGETTRFVALPTG